MGLTPASGWWTCCIAPPVARSPRSIAPNPASWNNATTSVFASASSAEMKITRWPPAALRRHRVEEARPARPEGGNPAVRRSAARVPGLPSEEPRAPRDRQSRLAREVWRQRSRYLSQNDDGLAVRSAAAFRREDARRFCERDAGDRRGGDPAARKRVCDTLHQFGGSRNHEVDGGDASPFEIVYVGDVARRERRSAFPHQRGERREPFRVAGEVDQHVDAVRVRPLDLLGERCGRVIDDLADAVAAHPLLVGDADVRDSPSARLYGKLRRERANAAAGADDQHALPGQRL